MQCIPNIFSVNFHWTFLQYQVKIHNEIHNKIQSKKISMRGNFYSKSADVQFRITIQQTKIKKNLCKLRSNQWVKRKKKKQNEKNGKKLGRNL